MTEKAPKQVWPWEFVKKLDAKFDFEQFREEEFCCSSIHSTDSKKYHCQLCPRLGDHTMDERRLECTSPACGGKKACPFMWRVFSCEKASIWKVYTNGEKHKRDRDSDCGEKHNPRITDEMKNYILEQVKDNQMPRMIYVNMKESSAIARKPEVWPSLEQVQGYVQYLKRRYGIKRSRRVIRKTIRRHQGDADVSEDDQPIFVAVAPTSKKRPPPDIENEDRRLSSKQTRCAEVKPTSTTPPAPLQDPVQAPTVPPLHAMTVSFSLGFPSAMHIVHPPHVTEQCPAQHHQPPHPTERYQPEYPTQHYQPPHPTEDYEPAHTTQHCPPPHPSQQFQPPHSAQHYQPPYSCCQYVVHHVIQYSTCRCPTQHQPSQPITVHEYPPYGHSVCLNISHQYGPHQCHQCDPMSDQDREGRTQHVQPGLHMDPTEHDNRTM